MKSYSSREIIKILKRHGWYHIRTVGSHHQFKPPTKKGKITVPHPKKNLPIKTVKSIFEQAEVKLD